MSSSQNRSVVIVGILAIALGLAAVAFFLLGDSPKPKTDEGSSRIEVASKPVEEIAQANNPDAPKASEPSAGRAEASNVPAAKPKEVFPAAYEKALAGLVGRVVEPDGTPVKGAKVELLGGMVDFFHADAVAVLFNPDAFDPRIELQSVKTGADGKFHFSKVDPRPFHLLGVNLGAGRPQLRFIDRTPNPGEPAADLGDIALDPPLTIVGKVVDTGGRAIAGARVRVSGLPAVVYQVGVGNVGPDTGLLIKSEFMGTFLWSLPAWTRALFEKLPFPGTTAGADGSFKIEGAPAGPLTLIVDGAELPVSIQSVAATKNAQKDLGDVVASRGEELEGNVVDENGKGVPGAELIVGIYCPVSKEVAFLRKPIVAGADGHFLAKGIGADKVAIVARAPDGGDWKVCDDVEVTGDPVKVKVPAPRVAVLRLTDEHEKPIAGAKIAVARDFKQREGRERFSPSLIPQMHVPVRIKVESAEPGSYKVRGLQAGYYKLFAEAEGYAIGSKAIAIEPNAADPEVSLALAPAHAIRVKVIGKENGEWVPLEAASVFAVRGENFDKQGFLALGVKRTGPDGVASVRAVGTGKALVFASHPGYANRSIEASLPETKDATIELLTGGTIEGQVTKDGKPAGPTTIVISPHYSIESKGQIPRFTVTDAEGKFSVSHLYPGQHEVTAIGRIGATNFATVPTDFFDMFGPWHEPPAHTQTAVVDEQVTRVELDLGTGERKPGPDDGQILGRVTRNGNPVVKANIQLSGEEYRRARTDENGNFDFGPVKAGQYHVEVNSTGKGGSYLNLGARQVKVAVGEQKRVDIDVVTAGPVRGIVKSADTGAPISGVWLNAQEMKRRNASGKSGNEGEDGNDYSYGPSVATSTNAAGEFEFEEIPEGNYRISAYHQGHAPATSDDILVTRGSTPPQVVLLLHVGVTVSGLVSGDIPTKADYMGLSFNGLEGTKGSGWAQIKEDRAFTIDTLTPGKYQVYFYTWSQDGSIENAQYETQTLEVPAGGLKGVNLSFQKQKAQLVPAPAPGGK